MMKRLKGKMALIAAGVIFLIASVLARGEVQL